VHSGSQFGAPPDVPVKIQKMSNAPESLPEWIEAVGVDYSYQPPPERVIKPVACMFIKPRIAGTQPPDDYYRAIYLMQRTQKDLINEITRKVDIEPSKVLRTLRVNNKGLHIVMDDDSVREMLEGQDMIGEFHAIRPHSPMKREWDSGPTDIQVDGDLDIIHTTQSQGYELRLLY